MSLFQSAAWQRAWWETWGPTAGFKLVEEGGSGRSGLYLDSYRWRGVVPVRCLQFIGTNYRRISTPRTEYNRLSDVPGGRDLAGTLGALPWNEAVFRDLVASSPEVAELRQLCKQQGWLLRAVHQDVAYRIATNTSFEQYLASLGPNTRRRLFNRRQVLENCGAIRRSNYWPDNTELFFDHLNAFHKVRWGEPCFGGQSLAFHRHFLEEIVQEGGQPMLSVLFCDNKVISLLYNVAFEGAVYNIQSGFSELFHKKLALGTIHLGYCLEEACLDATLKSLDLLAGGGKNEDYKKRLATEVTPLLSLMVVRGRLLKLLYRLKG